MNFTVFIAVIAVVVCLILFWPKKKEKPQDLDETSSVADSAEAEKPKKPIKKKPVKADQNKQAEVKQDKKKAKLAKKADKQISKKPVKKMQPEKPVVSDLSDDELLSDVTSSEPAANNESKAEPFSYGAPVKKAESKSEDTKPAKKPLKKQIKKNAASENNESSAKPEIKMDSEPPVHSNRNRVRKKLNSETEQVKKDEKEAIHGVAFVGADVQGFETPNVDDLFSDPTETEKNYQDMLSKATDNIDDLPSDTPMIIGAPVDEQVPPVVVIDDVPQVSMNLEPIDETPQIVSPDPVPDEVQEPADLEQTDAPLAAAEDTSVPASEEIAEPETTEQAETTEQVETKSADEDTTACDSVEKFEPGSVNFDNTGLKFTERPHTVKATELLPKELPVNTSEDGVVISIESPTVKAPVKKDGMIEIYNSHLYKDKEVCPWDIRFEKQLSEGEEITVDTGIGIRVPDGYGIAIVPVKNLLEKFSLEITSPLDVSRADAQYSLKFTVKAVGLSAYIAKNQALVQVKIFKI